MRWILGPSLIELVFVFLWRRSGMAARQQGSQNKREKAVTE